MKAEMIPVEDIKMMGSGGKLIVTLPSFLATVAARNQVNYVRKAYPRADGMTYVTSTDKETNTITIEVVTLDEFNKRNK